MKDYLNQNIWWNRPVKNPTQTRYNRFRLSPHGKLKTRFSDAVEAFDKAMEPYKTIYEKEFGEF